MSQEEIFNKVKEIIVEQLGVQESAVTMEASFIDDLGADSLDIVELIMALEEEFDLEIPDADAEKVATVGDVVSYLKDNTLRHLFFDPLPSLLSLEILFQVYPFEYHY